MKKLSKSRSTLFCQCPKALWLKTYKPELSVTSDALQQRFQAGSVVGDLAKGLFGKYIEITIYNGDGRVLVLLVFLILTLLCIKLTDNDTVINGNGDA